MRSIQDVACSTGGSTPQPPAGVILVTGSRKWSSAQVMHIELATACQRVRAAGLVPVIRHGACPKGADLMASQWCRAYGVPQDPQPADWSGYGLSAGFIRNGEMCTPDVRECLAFGLPCPVPGCDRWPFPHATHGTQDCVLKAIAAGIPFRWILP